MSKKILILVGPSGSGKTTVGLALEEKGIHKLITTTTRSPRQGEKDGIDYYFIENDNIDQYNFLETTIYNHQIYGLTKEELNKKWEIYDRVQVTLDRNGAKAVSELYPDQSLVVYFETTLDEMRERMEARGDAEEKIVERLDHSIAQGEMDPPENTQLIVRNEDVAKTMQTILAFMDQYFDA